MLFCLLSQSPVLRPPFFQQESFRMDLQQNRTVRKVFLVNPLWKSLWGTRSSLLFLAMALVDAENKREYWDMDDDGPTLLRFAKSVSVTVIMRKLFESNQLVKAGLFSSMEWESNDLKYSVLTREPLVGFSFYIPPKVMHKRSDCVFGNDEYDRDPRITEMTARPGFFCAVAQIGGKKGEYKLSHGKMDLSHGDTYFMFFSWQRRDTNVEIILYIIPKRN